MDGIRFSLPLIVLLISLPAFSQTQEMTSADRQAMLYAPQLQFTTKGDPLIRVGIMEGRKSMTFTPDRDIRVLPTGNRGPEITLPGKTKYTVSISKSKPGKYKHLVVVNRIPADQQKKVSAVQQTWLSRGYQTEIVEVGGLFAVKGEVFDSRMLLVGITGMTSRKKAFSLRRKLESKFGIRGGVHSELSDHPTGTITITGQNVRAKIRANDVMWIAAENGHEEKIRYTIPNIERSYGKGRETRTYTGTLVFAPDRDGKLVTMVSLGAERLLKGVVPAEIFASAPKDALRAQAVAARNEIFSAIGVRNLAEPYMLRADVMDQVYGGVGVEDSRTSAAVDATRGNIMFFGKRVINAYYSSNSGGFTENNENVWDMAPLPYLRGRPDGPKAKVPKFFTNGISENELSKFLGSSFPGYAKTAPVSSSKLYRWTKTVKASAAEKWLAKNGQPIGKLRDVKVTKRGVSGRVIQIKLTGTTGKATVERELNVRRMFGGLRSGLFIFTPKRNADGSIASISFSGAGFGHGVGMCQTGATGMAHLGNSYKQILKHYYRGIDIRKLY